MLAKDPNSIRDQRVSEILENPDIQNVSLKKKCFFFIIFPFLLSGVNLLLILFRMGIITQNFKLITDPLKVEKKNPQKEKIFERHTAVTPCMVTVESVSCICEQI
jgi:hypothetical protein